MNYSISINLMETLFLAQAFGIFFVIAGLGMILKESSMRTLVTKLSSDRTSVMLGGYFSLILGIPLVLVHNVWGTPLEMIISALVWITFLKGVTRVLMPDLIIKLSSTFADNMGMMKVLIWLMVALGAYLVYVGFGM